MKNLPVSTASSRKTFLASLIISFAIMGTFLVEAVSAQVAGQSHGVEFTEQDGEDVAYIFSVSNPGAPRTLNLADEREYRFYMKQLALAGLSADRYPKVFAEIEKLRKEHQAGRIVPALPAVPDTNSTGVGDATSMHTIVALGDDPNVTTTGGKKDYLVTGLSALGSPALNRTLTLSLYNDDGASPALLGQTTSQSDYSQAPLVSFSNGTINAPVENLKATFTYQYTLETGYTNIGTVTLNVTTGDGAGDAAVPATVTLPTINNTGPVRKTHASSDIDDNIVICANRSITRWTQCDYGPTSGSPGPVSNLLIDVSGSITFPNAVTVNTNNTPSGEYYVTLTVTSSGGDGCFAFGAQTGSNAALFYTASTTSWSTNKKTLTYNFSNDDFALADPGCMTTGTIANYSLYLQLTDSTSAIQTVLIASLDPDAVGEVPDTTTNGCLDGAYPSNECRIPQLEIYAGCFAPGTEIELADGSLLAVEDFLKKDGVHEQVRAHDGRILTVRGDGHGTEDAGLVNLETANGYDIQVTLDHPVVAMVNGADGGETEKALLARELRVGDKVVTKDGLSPLTVAEIVPYSGKVYQLYLGSRTELEDGGMTTMFSNGIATGDGKMQQALAKEYHSRPRTVLSRLPREWATDYKSWLEDEAARSAANGGR